MKIRRTINRLSRRWRDFKFAFQIFRFLMAETKTKYLSRSELDTIGQTHVLTKTLYRQMLQGRFKLSEEIVESKEIEKFFDHQIWMLNQAVLTKLREDEQIELIPVNGVMKWRKVEEGKTKRSDVDNIAYTMTH